MLDGRFDPAFHALFLEREPQQPSASTPATPSRFASMVARLSAALQRKPLTAPK